jgi:nickel-type superoxide dismutase maturation protease
MRRTAAVVGGGAFAALLALGVAALRRSVRRVEVVGSSMVPTLLPADRLIVVRRPPIRSYWPQPGQIVALSDPRQPGRTLVKRVTTTDRAQGTVAVEGDAGGASTDSRTFGPVPVGSAIGPAVYRYAPPHRRGRLPRPGEYHRA